MATITIHITYSNGCDTDRESVDFDLDTLLINCIEERVEERLEELGDEWYLVEYRQGEDDSDWVGADSYDLSLAEYAEFVENCDKYGEAFDLRFQDVGKYANMEGYENCWESEKEYAQEYAEGIGDIPDHLWCHVDWDSYARDLLTDHSTYDGDEGCHIFRDY